MTVKELIEGQFQIVQQASCSYGKPKVSVLVSIENGLDFLAERSLHSALHQTLREVELVIVHSGGECGVFQQVMSLAAERQGQITYIEFSNQRQNKALPYYLALRYSEAAYISFLTTKCVWQPEFLENLRRFMVRRELEAAYGEMLSPLAEGVVSYGGAGANPQDLISHNVICENAVMIRRSVLDTAGFISPHILIQTHCFQEFFYRISHAVPFLPSHLFSGYGTPPDYRERKTTALENWTAHEFISSVTPDNLLPSVYCEYDIDSLPRDASTLLCQTACANGRGIRRRRILTLVPVRVNACVSLYEERIPRSDDVDVRILIYDTADLSELVYADMVILVRDLFGADRWVDMAQRLGIPVYFFTDDNFIVLHKEYPNEPTFFHYTPKKVKQQLTHFQGIFCSTLSLVEYYRQFHANVMLFAPIMGRWMAEREAENEGFTVISYMGGPSRLDSVKQYLLPALKRLSQEFPLRFVVPSFVDTTGYQSDRLEIYKIPMVESLDSIVMEYSRYKVDIQLHCSIDTDNNRYKTINALMNSVQVGCSFIASDTAPFNTVEGKEELYLLAENSEEGWYGAIKTMVSDKSLRKRLYQSALLYCMTHFNGHEALASLKKELDKLPVLDNAVYEVRIRETNAEEPRFYQINWEKFNLEDSNSDKPRPVPPALISGPCNSESTVKIEANRAFHGVSFLIGTHGKVCAGTAILQLMGGSDRSFLLRQASCSLEDVGDNGWITFYFPALTVNSYVALKGKLYIHSDVPISLYELKSGPWRQLLCKICPRTPRPVFYQLEDTQ